MSDAQQFSLRDWIRRLLELIDELVRRQPSPEPTPEPTPEPELPDDTEPDVPPPPTANQWAAIDIDPYPYQLWRPTVRSDQTYPLILWLHSIGNVTGG